MSKMPRIPITHNSYELLPEGEYVFGVTGVEYDDKFGRLTLHLITAQGRRHDDRYFLLDSKGEPNSAAYSAFSATAYAITDDQEADSVDPDELVGKYFSASLSHDEKNSKANPGKKTTFVKLTNKRHASGFDSQPTEEVLSIMGKAGAPADDPLDYLG